MIKFNQAELKRYEYYVAERWAIQQRREAGQLKTWTKDKILQTYKFCCVRREDDRVTIWIKEHIREPFEGHPHLWFMLAAARQINWPDTLQELIHDRKGAWPNRTTWSPERMREVMRARQERGEKLYTGAYMINAQYGKETQLASDKAYFTAHLTLGKLWDDRKSIPVDIRAWKTLESAHVILKRYRGWGDFLAAQVVADWKHTHILEDAPDWWDWAVLGPGSIKGLNYLVQRPETNRKSPLKQPWKPAEAIEALQELRRVARLPVKLCLQDMQNLACEYSKYRRTELGTGRPRSYYEGGA